MKRKPVVMFGISAGVIGAAWIMRTGINAHSDRIEFAPSGDLASTKRLIAYGEDVNRKEEMDSTPLMQAARNGDPDSLKTLLDKRADTEAADASGRTAINWAIFMYKLSKQARYSEASRLMIEHGAKLDHRDNQKRTYLMSALDAGDANTAELLIARGADVNAADSNGHTALMYVMRGALTGPQVKKVCSELIAKHANPKMKNSHGKTALDLANASADKETREAGVKALAGS